jgi:hypothetical protein
MVSLCEWCIKVEEECRQKVWELECERCAQRKVGCSVVGLKRKGLEKRAEQRVTEDEKLIAPLELSDRVIEQVKAMVKELRKISGGIWVLVKGVGKLTEAVEGMKKEEVRKVDKETETEEKEEDSKEEEESEEEVEKEKKGDNGEESESESKSDGTEDGEEGGKK